MGLLTNIIDQFNDILFERINSQNLDDTTKRVIKKRVVLMILIFGILLMPAYFYGTGWILGVTPKDHWKFLQGKDPYEERYILLQRHLNKVNNEINKYEKISLKRQKVLFSLLEHNVKDTKQRTEALKIVNRTQDIITKLMELGKFYAVLVKNGEQNEATQKALLLMYEGWLDILISDYQPSAIANAYNKYVQVYNEYLNDFPEVLRLDVKIELLNVLTYCEARRKYPERSRIYLAEAKGLLTDSILPIDYRRKYYWINFAEFIDAVSHLDEPKASKAFKTLNERLNDPAFLRAKLIQHSGMISEPDQKVMVNNYLSKLSYE